MAEPVQRLLAARGMAEPVQQLLAARGTAEPVQQLLAARLPRLEPAAAEPVAALEARDAAQAAARRRPSRSDRFRVSRGRTWALAQAAMSKSAAVASQ